MFIRKRNPSKPIISNTSLTIRIRLQFELFFLNDCLSVSSYENRFCGNRLKKIASYGVWGNGRFPQLYLPSALAVAKQVCSFLFAYRIVDFNFVHLANKKLYSCGQIWFLRMPKSNYELRIINYEFGSAENVKHLQKTMN